MIFTVRSLEKQSPFFFSIAVGLSQRQLKKRGAINKFSFVKYADEMPQFFTIWVVLNVPSAKSILII